MNKDIILGRCEDVIVGNKDADGRVMFDVTWG